MSARPTRDASRASNMLTRKLDRHLLSTFNESPKVDDGEPSSSRKTEIAQREPSVDAEPLSSSESEKEEDQSDIENRRKYGNEPTLEEKRAAARDADAIKKKGGLARTSSVRTADNDDMFSSWSQSSKKPRTTFARPRNYSRGPTSSARSIPTPEKPSPNPKPASKANKEMKKKNNIKKDKEDSEESEPENSFKVPMNIDVPSPVKTKSETKENKVPTSPQFKIPRTIFDDEPAWSSSLAASSRDLQRSFEISSQSSLSSPLTCPSSPSIEDESQQLSDLELKAQIRSPSPPRKSLCPMCKAEVDPEMLKEFQAQSNQRLRAQQRFCASHKKDMATKEWEAQGYPEINWNTFTERLQGYFSGLEKYFTSDEPSYFRNLLESAQKSGSNLRLTLEGEGIETISCGYYGTKGAQKMLDAVMGRFAVRLRRMAKDDSLVAKVGVVGYSQSVLVPELATRLIMDDMNVAADTAREIMRDSLDIGQKINPQQDDVVPFDDSDFEDDYE